MACDAQTLQDDANCFLVLSRRQLLASWAYQTCNWLGPVESGTELITPEGEGITTPEGETIVTP